MGAALIGIYKLLYRSHRHMLNDTKTEVICGNTNTRTKGKPWKLGECMQGHSVSDVI